MQEGDVVLTPVPQADGTVKNRPAIVLREMPVYRDVLVCGVSTQLHQHVQGFDEIISPSDADFASSGLVSPSLIRLGFLAVVPRRNILGTIGAIAPERHKRLLQAQVKEVTLSHVKDDLSRYLREAESRQIVITRHGKPAGVLIGFGSEEDWFDYRLENDPRFLERIARSRESARAGRTVKLEDLKA